jgi:phage terminase large subunit GpA-like protein
MAFAVATCPHCSGRFRLIWRIGKRKLEPSQAIRLTCPHCGGRFEQIAVRLVVFDAGGEHFPATATVDETCLVTEG